MHRRALLLALSLISSAVVQAGGARVPLNTFTDLGLTSQQTAAIDAADAALDDPLRILRRIDEATR